MSAMPLSYEEREERDYWTGILDYSNKDEEDDDK